MFDDQDNKSAPNAANPPRDAGDLPKPNLPDSAAPTPSTPPPRPKTSDRPSPGQAAPIPPPPARPTGTPTPPSQSQAEPEDILSDVEAPAPSTDSGTPKVLAPDGPVDPRLPQAPTPTPPVEAPSSRSGGRVFLILISIVLGLAVLAGAGYFAYVRFFASSPTVETTQPTPSPAAIAPPAQTSQFSPNVNAPATTPEPSQPTQTIQVDSDSDGLTDEEEATFGTDPNNVDTDGDGLYDRDEVKIFKTDPNNTDTDGDGFLDAEEIRAGYDPKGPGRLLEIE